MVTLPNGSTAKLEVTAVGADLVEGTLDGTQAVKHYAAADLRMLDRQQTSWWKTGALTYVLLAPLIAAAILKSALTNAFKAPAK